MGYTHIEVEPVTHEVGAIVTGVRPARVARRHRRSRSSPTPGSEHKVLFLPDQPIDRDQHKRFARYFGEIYRHPYLKDVTRDPDIVPLYSGGDTGSRYVAEGWHTDVTFSPEPPMGSILRSIVVPAYGGDTMWIDLEAALSGLSPTMREFAATLYAIHSAPRAAFVPGDTSGEVITSKHPVVRTHPGDRPAVPVREPGLHPPHRRAEARPSRTRCSTMFHAHCQTPEYQVRIHWQPDMIAMWDNRCTQHKVVADNLDALRKMERITLQGEVPA